MAVSSFLIPGGAETFRPAQGCPVAMAEYTSGLYFPHRGDTDSFMAAQVQITDGSAEIVLALWRCVYCHMIVVGIGKPAAGEDEDSMVKAELTWYEEIP